MPSHIAPAQAIAIGSPLQPVAVLGPVPTGANYSAAPLGVLLDLMYPYNVSKQVPPNGLYVVQVARDPKLPTGQVEILLACVALPTY